MRAITSAGLVVCASSHGAVTIPPPRNAVDGVLDPWTGAVPFPPPFEGKEQWCATPSAKAAGKDPRNLTGSNGQACFWFSNGCDIGSGKCDGNSGQIIHPKFIYNGTGSPPSWGAEGITPDPNFKQPIPTDPTNRPQFISYPNRKATICDSRLRTLNTAAPCGSAEDFWFFSPWRYPGSAPVIDPCGAAGGRLVGQGPGSAGASYTNTSLAKLADKGSSLKPAPSGTVWLAGSDVEVAWTQKAWHGGGYSFRLCPANESLTEACFQKMPLQFSGNSSLRWGGVGGEQIFFNTTELGWETIDGTNPPGSMWRKCPIPRGPWGYVLNGASFDPVCEESAECANAHSKKPPFLTCKCSGDGIGDIPTLEIVDKVHIPADLPEGDYVLGWRWDCEQSTQVWSSCSDVTVKH